jgi:DNA-binding response OmpR family regulator
MNKRVLLIEDDRIVRENTREILELAGYEVSTAENGKKGVELALSDVPDIIICDILMPELDGYGVLQIVSKNSLLEHIPFIFLTAKTDHDNVRMGMDLGADDYIMKPFEESELLRAIETRLKRVEVFEHKGRMPDQEMTPSAEGLYGIKNIEQFLAQKEVFNYGLGDTIYCAGNQSSHVFLIKKGLVKTFIINEQGKEFITGFYRDKQIFGFNSFVRREAHREFSKAVEPTQLYKITKDELKSIINNNHHIIYHFIDLLAGSNAQIREQLVLMAYGSVRSKTARTLYRLNRKMPGKAENEITISRIDLASSIGIAKETLIRTLHDFKEEGLVDLKEKSIHLKNPKHLLKVF